MKKMFGLLASLLVVFSLTGCGNELKCTGEVDGQKMTAKATLDGEKITKVVMESVSEAESKEEAENGAKLINGLGAMASESGITMVAKANGKKVTMTMTMDVTKMKSEDLEEEFDTAELTKDSFIKAMEEEGLTCK